MGEQDHFNAIHSALYRDNGRGLMLMLKEL